VKAPQSPVLDPTMADLDLTVHFHRDPLKLAQQGSRK
jgi:hypothetical protein